MKHFYTAIKCIVPALLVIYAGSVSAQPSLRSLLINHGSNTCGSTVPQQQLIAGTVSGSPSLVFSGANGVPFYNVYTAYNPKDKKIYFADISSGSTTRVYAMDYNLTGLITASITSTPTYTYPFTIDQFCFDKNGNNIAIYNYNSGSAIGRLKSMDLATGADIPGTDKQLDFAPGFQPNSLGWGDIVYMPNGRIFMTFGNAPSRLYELINFEGPGNATAVFLSVLPRPCYSIGYVDGNLIVGGSDGSGCYYYVWDIALQSLGAERSFPLGMTTADISHMNVGVGLSEELVSSVVLGGGQADLDYRMVIKNKGNISLSSLDIQNNLAATFGNGNISNVQVDFIENPAGLVLNPAFDGQSNLQLFQPGQTLDNFPVAADSVVIRIRLRASNLVPGVTYYNSTIGKGQVGAGSNLMDVRDSSNNGDATMIDMDFNGVSDDPGEGIPTPFVYNVLLPYYGLECSATNSGNEVMVDWTTSQEVNMDHYEVEKSTDGRNFYTISSVAAKNNYRNQYHQKDDQINTTSGKIYYRLKMLGYNGTVTHSKTMVVTIGTKGIQSVKVYPNPFEGNLQCTVNASSRTQGQIILRDGTGRAIHLYTIDLHAGSNVVHLTNLQNLNHGLYYLEWIVNSEKGMVKLIK